MVCTRCTRNLARVTTLATPSVNRKSELYHGSPASSSSGISKSASKNKLLSKSAKNPYAAYGGSCETCKGKTEQGKKFCHRCAFKEGKCAMCGKKLAGEAGTKAKVGEVSGAVNSGQRFSAK